jgi:hypothetical protein
MNNSQSLTRLFGWLGAAVAAALVVLFFVFVFQGGSCSDAAPGQGDSVCTSGGPAVGAAAAWGITIVGGIVIIFSVTRAVLIGRRRNKMER